MQLVVEYFHYRQTLTEKMIEILMEEQKRMFLETGVMC